MDDPSPLNNWLILSLLIPPNKLVILNEDDERCWNAKVTLGHSTWTQNIQFEKQHFFDAYEEKTCPSNWVTAQICASLSKSNLTGFVIRMGLSANVAWNLGVLSSWNKWLWSAKFVPAWFSHFLRHCSRQLPLVTARVQSIALRARATNRFPCLRH